MKRVIKADNNLKSGKGFSYILKHGLGPGTLPKDVEIIDHTEDGYKDIVWLNRRLNTDELKYYDIKPYGVAINVMEATNHKRERALTFKYPYESIDVVNKIQRLLDDNGVEFILYKSDGYYPHEFVVRKGSYTWNDIMRLVNSVKAPKYSYKNTEFGDRDGKLVEYEPTITITSARRDYGGAYDIDPYSYFTKEDLMEFAYELVDKIGETTGVRTDVSDVYTRGDDTIVIELDCNGSVSRQSFKYDLRRVRKPSDIKKYITPTFMFKFIEDFHNIGEIEDDVYERLEREIWK